ncbi:Transposase [Phytophthora cinnamomi]|uniref:Transposase n=1 Tax=Phytophthora cinnamomi TaxID=4785 RepID=UPI00355A551E|nr:Transposase [Phytophthora cinnamomi]
MALQSTPQTPPPISREAKQFERASAKKRVLDAYLAGQDWLGVAASNAVSMTVEVMSKLEEYLDEQADMTMAVMKERLLSDVSAEVSISSIHRALHGMLYTVKGLRIEKATTNNDVNKTKRKEFAIALNKHVFAGDMIVYHDETNFNIYLARNQGWVRTGKRAVVTLPPPKGKNLYVQCGVSPGNGLVLLRTHEGSIRMEENTRFVADLFVTALNSDEYKEWLVTDGIVNSNKLVILRLAPYSPMCNAIEGCCNALKASMKQHLAVKRHELFLRGEYDSLASHRMALMKEAVELSKMILTQRLVWRMERHCF